MLAPLLLDVEEDLADLSNVLRYIGGFAQSCLSATVAQMDPPLEWITDMQSKFQDLRTIAQRWLDSRVLIIPPLVLSFSSYSATVSAATQHLNRASTSDDWKTLLTTLHDAARANSSTASAVQEMLKTHHGELTEAHEEVRQAIQNAEEALNKENADLEQVEVALQSLFDQLATFGGPASAQDLSLGKSLVQTTVSLTYDVMVAGEMAVPYFAIAATLFSIGASVYENVVTDAALAGLLDKMKKLLTELDADIRAIAMTHAVLVLLNAMDQAYTGAAQLAPRINAYWDAEADKISIVLQELNATTPDNIAEVASMPAAATVWQQLSKVALAMAMPMEMESRVAELHVLIATP